MLWCNQCHLLSRRRSYCTDVVMPLLAALSLLTVSDFALYKRIAATVLPLLSLLQTSSSADYARFMQPLLALLLTRFTCPTPHPLPCPILSSGLTLTSLRNKGDFQLKSLLPDFDKQEGEEERVLFLEIAHGETPRTRALYNLLNTSSHLPALVRSQRPLSVSFTRYTLGFLLYHSSTISLYTLTCNLILRTMLYAEYLVYSTLSLPPFLLGLWRRVIMLTCSLESHALTEETIERLAFLTTHLNPYFDGMQFSTPSSSSLSMDFDDMSSFPPTLRQLYLLPQSSSIVSLSYRDHPSPSSFPYFNPFPKSLSNHPNAWTSSFITRISRFIGSFSGSKSMPFPRHSHRKHPAWLLKR